MYRTVILLLVQLVTHIHDIDAQFINNPPDIENRCSGGTSSVNFNWSYATSSSILIVEWKKDGSLIADEPVGLSQPFSPASSYVGRLNKITNAQISLGSLSIADSGIYTCEVTYTNGNAYISNSISLNVYDEWNNETKIQMTSGNGMVTLSAVFFDLSITYTWKLQNTVIYVGSSLAVKKNGNYTLCVSGGRADCVTSSLSPCASIDVTGFDENESSNLGLVLGLGFGLGIPGGAVVISLVFFIYHKKKSSSKPTKPSVNVKLITQTTAEFTVTFKPNAPPPTKLKVIVTAQTKRTKYYNVEVENGAPKPVTVELEDLTPSTSYMFEFAGENDAGEGPARTVSKNTQAFDIEDGDHGKGRSQNNTGSNTNRTATGRVGL